MRLEDMSSRGEMRIDGSVGYCVCCWFPDSSNAVHLWPQLTGYDHHWGLFNAKALPGSYKELTQKFNLDDWFGHEAFA